MLDRWTAHLEATRSPGTSREYANAVRYFQVFCMEHGHEKMNTATLQSYIDLISRTLAPRTVHQRVVAIREYLVYCNYTPGKLKLPSIPQSVPRHLNPEQLAVFLDETQKIKHHGVRAVLMLLPMTGLRIDEVLNLTMDSIERDVDGAWLRVVGKRKKIRRVPLVKGAEAVIATYTRRDAGVDMGTGVRTRLFSVTYSQVYEAVKRISARMGLPWLHPHVLRHTFATQLRENDVDMADIQDLLGHVNLSTTAIYAHATRKTARRAVERGLGVGSDKKEGTS